MLLQAISRIGSGKIVLTANRTHLRAHILCDSHPERVRQVLVDGKNFRTAIDDYNAAQRLSEQGINKVQVRKLGGCCALMDCSE